ncbi:PREDICTED: DEAD-box ATP-dependent RNA helicase 42-like [Camelina sativa]|uniref:DEAD-box ATP-dependent RNA helicase 42-like n=1 Tax=Camelina sativa TaxID=90675 RepID=A0ABM0ULM5_CAMSA|nr:PREDICTED: DEAD-box ATP-dependent RNA helicase 42-like [Camelina sativa]
MGKSSSSSKKLKHSTDSSTKLRSVKKKKKRTKRNKSKKIRRVIKDYSDESESSFSDSSLYSSSSSEDDYRRKKMKRRQSKLSKKRSRKRYSSSESDDDDDDDDDSGLLKKRKRSKRKDESLGKKKKKRLVSRKRRKRDLSSSSTSSEQSDDDDGSESDGKRRSRDRGRLGKVKDVRRRSRDESSEPDEYLQVEDEVIPEKSSRRLKSIIVVSYGYGNDEGKEEDDRDVYMTRSGNREFGLSDESDERDGETNVSYARARADDENGGRTVGYDDFLEYNESETSKVSHRDNSMKDDDLEAILKKRALENLKRFRGVNQKSGMIRKEVSSVSEGEPLQIESEKVEDSQDHGLMEQNQKSAVSKDLETSEKIVHVVNVKELGTALANSASQQDQQPGDTAKVKASSSISSCSTKRKLIRPLLGKESLNLASRNETAGGQGAEAENINGSTIDKNCPESSLALAPENGGENIEPTKVSSSLNAQSSSHAGTETLDETKDESHSEQKKVDETNDESQYEQKTMTVMRGGEMVQVSYKVYIPKKASSLGRRKLNR